MIRKKLMMILGLLILGVVGLGLIFNNDGDTAVAKGEKETVQKEAVQPLPPPPGLKAGYPG